MVHMSESTFLSSDGKSAIYYREYLPPVDAKGILQIAHGVAEHIARYDSFARFLAENGYIVVSNDHLGHGRSAAGEDALGFFSESGGWEKVVADMRKLHDLTAAKFPARPYFLFGHSMGSFLARTYIIRIKQGLDGVILSGTGQPRRPLLAFAGLIAGQECRKHGKSFKSQKLQTLIYGKYNDGLPGPRTLFDWLSRDESVVDAYIQDPLCGFVPSAGLFLDLIKGIDFVSRPRNLARMRKDLPVLFLSGESDPVGGRGEGVIRAYRSFLKAGMQSVTMKLYHEGRHEMLNEQNSGEVFEDILEWLDAKAGKRAFS